jgi:hypothetical protein
MDGYRQPTAKLETFIFAAGNEKILSAQTVGTVAIDIYGLSAWWKNTDIHIGSGGYSPVCTVVNYAPCRIILSATDVANHGIMTHVAGTDIGIYVGFEPPAEAEIGCSSDAAYRAITAVLESAAGNCGKHANLWRSTWIAPADQRKY